MCFQRPRRKQENTVSHFDVRLINTYNSLPDDFAMRLLEREMHLERAFDKETVQDLIILYSKAIEYYNTFQDDQALNYQMRMQKMLKRPEVLRIYSLPSQLKPSSSETESVSNLSEAQKTLELNSEEKETLRSIQAEEAVKDIEISDKILGDKLVDSLKSQENQLLTRIHRRRNTKTMSNMFFIYSPSEAESPKLASEDNVENEMEFLIQDLMERSYEEKSEKIAEITVKYQTEIASMEDLGGMGVVVEQLKRNMNEEIEGVSKEFDDKRRAEVKALRDGFVYKSKAMSP